MFVHCAATAASNRPQGWERYTETKQWATDEEVGEAVSRY